jgi:hypothetical protein
LKGRSLLEEEITTLYSSHFIFLYSVGW